MVGELEDLDEEQLEEVSYIQNNGNFRAQQQPYFNQYRSNPNLSYRNPNVANPQDQSYPPRNFTPRPQGNNNFRPFQPQATQQQQPAATSPDVTNILNQILKGQSDHSAALSALKTEVHRKIDASHAELSSRLEQLTSRVQFLEAHQDSTSNVKVTGQLPGKAIMNPKEFNVSCISVCSANDTPQVFDKDTTAEDSNDQKRGAEQIATKVRNSENPQEEPALDTHTRQAECRVSILHQSSGKIDPSFGKPTGESALDSSTRQSECRVSVPEVENAEKSAKVERKSNPLPNLLKPSCLDMFKNPFQQQTSESTEIKCITIGRIGSTMIKHTDPGEITLTASIGSVIFPDCVVDTGAGVNTISLEACERFGFQNFKPCDYRIRLADYSVTQPIGILEDVQVDVGGVIIPTDFAVWDIPSATDSPILFGRPFLKSGRALIDMTDNEVIINADRGRRLSFSPHAQVMYDDEPEGRVGANPNIRFLLEPTEINNGVMEYKVRGGREPMPHERFIYNRFGAEESIGPFFVSRQTKGGTLAMAGTSTNGLPFNGQRVHLHIKEARRNQFPPPRNFC